MKRGYELALVGPSSRALLSQNAARRRRALMILEALCESPFRAPDFFERGPSGRTYRVIAERDLIVTYWLDDAVKELRVVDLAWI